MIVYNAQKMKLSIKDFLNKCDQIRSFLWIWSHLLKKSIMENFIFCAVLEINQINTEDALETDRKPSRWSESNRSWYVIISERVKLKVFYKDILSGTHNSLKMKENDIRNNLSKKERESLNLLPNYENRREIYQDA